MGRQADEVSEAMGSGTRGRRARPHGVDPQKEHGRHGATAHAEPGGDGSNVNGVERLLSIAAGGALAAYALRRKDLSGLALGVAGGMLVERGVSGHCMVYDAMGLTSAADDRGARPTRLRGGAATVDAKKAQKIERTVTIFGHEPSEVYAYWRRLENLPRIFRHLERVTETDARHSRWEAKAPAGRTVSWEAEIINEVPGEIIAWKSLPGSTIPNAGAVNFRAAPGGRGTEVKVSLEYEPPAGKLGVFVARMLGEEPSIQVREDLRRYKALVEAGELPVSANPGQGGDARETFDARVNRGETAAQVKRWQAHAPRAAHEPEHRPAPGDQGRVDQVENRTASDPMTSTESTSTPTKVHA